MKRSSAQAVSSGSADTRGWSGKSSLLEDTRASPNQTCQVWVFQRSDHFDLTRQTMASGEKDRISRFLTSMVFWKTATQHPEGTELFLFTACPYHIGFVDGRPVAQQHAFDWVPITCHTGDALRQRLQSRSELETRYNQINPRHLLHVLRGVSIRTVGSRISPVLRARAAPLGKFVGFTH